MTPIKTIDDALDTVIGGGAGYCDFAPPQWSTPREGAAEVLSAVYKDTGKVVPAGTLANAQSRLAKGADWNQVCSNTRRAVAPHYEP